MEDPSYIQTQMICRQVEVDGNHRVSGGTVLTELLIPNLLLTVKINEAL